MPKTPASEDFKAAENGHIQKNPAEMPRKDDFFWACGNSFYLYAQSVALSCYGLIQTRNCHGFCRLVIGVYSIDCVISMRYKQNVNDTAISRKFLLLSIDFITIGK